MQYLSFLFPEFRDSPYKPGNQRFHNDHQSFFLLNDVFGYEFGADNSITPYNESIPYFNLNLLVYHCCGGPFLPGTCDFHGKDAS